MEDKEYDVIIVGAGISGAALFYLLSNYTNIERIAIIEKYGEAGMVNSKSSNNSQTLHMGDIETNYNLEKATKVKKAADMVKNFVDNCDVNKKIHTKYHKMVLGIGVEEVTTLEKRYIEFKKLFPNFKKIDRSEIAKLEPKVVEGRNPKEKIIALFSEDGYTIDFGKLAKEFIKRAKKRKLGKKIVDIFYNTKLENIEKDDMKHKIYTNKGEFIGRYVVMTTGAHSLLYAKKLGYGKNFAQLSVAGSFYFVPKALNGKVYTVQLEKLPFAAIHGDPEVHDKNITRFGPTAKPLFMLERGKYNTVWEYFKTSGFKLDATMALIKILSDHTIFWYNIKNFMYDFPIIGKILFLKEIKKIVPTTKYNEVKYAKGYGGIRPQIINISKKRLDMGEAKIYGDCILFNITPSPGASTCLRNAEDDTIRIVKELKKTGYEYIYDSDKFKKELCDCPEV